VGELLVLVDPARVRRYLGDMGAAGVEVAWTARLVLRALVGRDPGPVDLCNPGDREMLLDIIAQWLRRTAADPPLAHPVLPETMVAARADLLAYDAALDLWWRYHVDRARWYELRADEREEHVVTAEGRAPSVALDVARYRGAVEGHRFRAAELLRDADEASQRRVREVVHAKLRAITALPDGSADPDATPYRLPGGPARLLLVVEAGRASPPAGLMWIERGAGS
jgi:hypothetical protein